MDPRTIKQNAAAALAQADTDPKKLALLHTGMVVLFSLAVSLISHFLEQGMNAAGGLSGLGIRSMLESAQVILSLAGTVVLPFWQIGFAYVALRYNRQQAVSGHSLLEGFRRFGPVLRLNLLLLLITMGVMTACAYISTTIFMFSPFSNNLYHAMENMINTTDIAAVTPEMMESLMPHMTGLLVINVLVALAIGLPFYYRFRLCEFALMNGAPGALAALRESTLLTRHRRMQLFRFDLSFWWYYLALGVIAAVAYVDALFAALGISLPLDPTAVYWILLVLHSLLSLLFARQFSPYYQVSYANYYDQLRQIATEAQNSPNPSSHSQLPE